MLQKTNKLPPISHVWIYLNGKVHIHESKNHEKTHEDCFNCNYDDEARGYIRGFTLSCHINWTRELLMKVEKECDKRGIPVGFYYGHIYSITREKV